jgi:hypothetical protein
MTGAGDGSAKPGGARPTVRFRQEPERRPRPAAEFLRHHRASVLLWAGVAVGLGLFLGWAVAFAPAQLGGPPPDVADLEAMVPKDRLAAEAADATLRNGIRTTLIQAVAGAAFLATAFFAWRQVAVHRLGQLTERFSKSVERLGDDSTAVRLGAIYTLEQLGDDDRFARPVAKTLVAYIREESRKRDRPAAAGTTVTLGALGAGQSVTINMNAAGPPGDSRQEESQPREQEPVSLDVQEAATVVVSRGLWSRAGDSPIDLAGARLPEIKLANAELVKAVLRKADLDRADLTGVDLSSADLRDTSLRAADLRRSVLSAAWMHRALLSDAVLDDAHAPDVKLEKASLDGASLVGAHLVAADFTRCDLRRVTAQGATLRRAVFFGADLRGADLSRADLTDADFTGAKVSGLVHTEAKTDGAIGLPPVRMLG